MTDVLTQLNGKKRTIHDLERFIGTRTGTAPNYALLLGSGCSVSSGVRSGGALIEEWRRELFIACGGDPEGYSPEAAKAFLAQNGAQWYSPQKEYSSLFEKKFDLPRQRRMFVESEVAGKNPSLGYAYLVRLVENDYVNCLFTTNFDDLLNEAFYQFSSTRPIVCAHDSSISSITVTSKRPKIIKLHGDYLFDDIKSTVRETESLEDNTRKKFLEFARDFGLVVVGYSGNDRSIMDVLHYLLRNDDYVKNGIYWCLRRNEVPSEELTKLLWKDGVYFVEVDGFDEVMAHLYRRLVGDELPISSLQVTARPRDLIDSYLKNSFLVQSRSEYIKRDLDRLRGENEDYRFVESFRRLTDASRRSGVTLFSESVQVVTARQLVAAGDYKRAKECIRGGIEDAGLNEDLVLEFLRLRLEMENLMEDTVSAVATCRELEARDPFDPWPHYRHSYLVYGANEKFAFLDKALELDPCFAPAHNARGDLLLAKARQEPVSSAEKTLELAAESFGRSLVCNPALSNKAWFRVSSLLASAVALSKERREEMFDTLLNDAQGLDPRDPVTLQLRLRYIEVFQSGDGTVGREFIDKLKYYRSACARSLYATYQMIYLQALGRFGLKDILREELDSPVDGRCLRDDDYLRQTAECFFRWLGDVKRAAVQAEAAFSLKKSFDNAFLLVCILCCDGQVARAKATLESARSDLSESERLDCELEIAEANGDFESVLALLQKKQAKRAFGGTQVVEQSFALMKLKRFAQAQETLKAFLERVSFSKAHGEAIVNYEIARSRLGEQINKKRLSDLIDSTCDDRVKGCACYLLDRRSDAENAFRAAVQKDAALVFEIRRWLPFEADAGKSWIESIFPIALGSSFA